MMKQRKGANSSSSSSRSIDVLSHRMRCAPAACDGIKLFELTAGYWRKFLPAMLSTGSAADRNDAGLYGDAVGTEVMTGERFCVTTPICTGPIVSV